MRTKEPFSEEHDQIPFTDRSLRSETIESPGMDDVNIEYSESKLQLPSQPNMSRSDSIGSTTAMTHSASITSLHRSISSGSVDMAKELDKLSNTYKYNDLIIYVLKYLKS